MNKINVLDQFTKHRGDHKSMVFLYPILQIPEGTCKPLNSYLYLNNVVLYKDRYLFVMYHTAQEGYAECKKQIEENELWDFCISDGNGYDIHAFTFEKYFEYYDRVMIGDYASFDTNFKLILSKHNHPVSLIGMHPELYHEDYAAEFKIPVEQLPKGAQLVQKPNPEHETLRVNNEVVKHFLGIRGELHLLKE